MDIYFSHNIYYKRFIQAKMVNFVILLFIQVVLQNIWTLFLISIKLEKEPNVMKVKKKTKIRLILRNYYNRLLRETKNANLITIT